MRFAVVTLLLLWLPAAVRAEILFVNNVLGSDTNSGTVETNQGGRDGPLKSIAAALKRSRAGGRIIVGKTDQPYYECLTFQGRHHSGSSLRPFVVEGNGATLDGTAPIPTQGWQHVHKSIYRYFPNRLGHQRLFLEGKLARQMPTDEYGNVLSNVMRPGQWCHCGGAIQFAADQGRQPAGYELRYAKHRVGITLYDVQRVLIRNLVVRGFQLDGVNAHDNAMECALSGVTSEANGRSGFSIGGASRLRLTECVSRDNGIVPLRSEGWSTTQLVGTTLLTSGGPTWTRHPTRHGGARMFIDGQPQTQLQGFSAALPNDSGGQNAPVPAEPDPFVDDAT